ncbi:MAG TPA: GYF domain-containing protein [Tepidisphaeraceae bacterium]|jgi:hypothetical protein|nr:GYF domain-containing protein [Tepidisphaeraceae bacterium]
MPQEYWVKIDGDDEEYGPYTGHQLKEYAATGQLNPESMVSLDHATWHVARRIKNLFPPAASAAAPTHAYHESHRAHAAAPAPAYVPPARPGSQAMAGAIQYGAAPATAVLTPDQRYRGVMLFLYIAALVLGLLLLLAGAVVVFALFVAAERHHGGVADTALVLPGAIILSAALFCAAGLLGILKLRVELLLAIGAVVFILARVGISGVSLFVENVDWPGKEADNWTRTVGESGRSALSLAFPILCLFGVAALWRARKNKRPANAISPWRSLTYGISAVALVSGVLLVMRYGNPVIEFREYATGHAVGSSPSDLRIVGQPTFTEQLSDLRREVWWRSLAALTMSIVLVLGAAITLISPRFGRFILLAGSAGMLAYAIFVLVMSGHASSPYRTMDAHVDDFGPVLLFFILAAIVVMCGGDSKARAGAV